MRRTGFLFTSVIALMSCLSPASYGQSGTVQSNLEIFDTGSGRRRVVHRESKRFEAPNWTRDGKHLIFNQQGLLYKIPVAGGKAVEINTGFARSNNNDHGISPDGRWLVISHHNGSASAGGDSTIYILPIQGGEPRQVTSKAPSYWHGWSPDGKTLAYVGLRNGDYDIYSIPTEGGDEKRLTTSPGLDDGPDYSPDGRYIYYNSVRSGRMQIWRMRADGSEQKQLTDDRYNNWFPHPSPDGRKLVFLTYVDSVDPSDHPPDRNVMLRLMDVGTGRVDELCRFTGGQGTINVPSWSPDSKQFAFVSYKLPQATRDDQRAVYRPVRAQEPAEDRALVWSDEFNGPKGSAVDPSKWVFDTGGGGWGNKELQFYTASTRNAAMNGKGHLVITAIRENLPRKNRCWYGRCRYSSARIKTRGKFERAYGRFEARMKLPKGQGIWPAFWMLGNNIDEAGWPACGEIDVMENIGREPSTAHGTLHGPGYSGGDGVGASYELRGATFSEDFHVFAVEWEPGSIRWYVDGNLYQTRTPADLPQGREWVFDHPFFLLLNVAVGGEWPGSPDATTRFPQKIFVDYVRVYQ